MRYNKFLSSAFLFLSLMVCSSVLAQKIPSKKKVLKVMRLTNQWFMNEWPDPGKPIFTNIERPSNIWTRGVYYEGLMELYKIDKQKEYLQYALDWGNAHKWGLRSGTATRHADNHCCGQTYIDLYNLGGRKSPEYIRDIKTSIDNMMATDKVSDWTWIDALQMAMPVFIKLGLLYNDTSYFHRMYEMYAHTKYVEGGGLFNKEDGLWWRDKGFVPPYKEPNGEDCYWSRGNGWVVAALAKTLESLPKTDPHYQEYLEDFKAMLKAVIKVQRPDGFWNVSLHDPNHFGGKETTGTALFVYGMAWGINNGVIDRETYLAPTLKAWNAMVTEAVHKDGYLGYVQGTGKEPKDGQPVSYSSRPDFTDYGLGCFLLAGSEMYRLKKK